MLPAARFLRYFLRPRSGDLRVEEVPLPVGAGVVDATLYLPRGCAPVPGWVVLHGITVAGRSHVSLTRFAAALAASGAAVLVPDVPSWRALRISVPATTTTLQGAAEYLAARPEVADGGIRVMGFSFGATQALVAAADPRVAARTERVVGFGGYCDLHRTLVCSLTGEHEWNGVPYTLSPDPYGRWIVAANYLTGVPGCENMQGVMGGLELLAQEAGRRRLPAGAGIYNPLKAEIRRGLGTEERRVWDLLAPPAAASCPDPVAGRELAQRLADAALAAEPLLDPRSFLPVLRQRVVLGHGRGDQLIPFTETLRLCSHLPARADAYATVTSLFAHSASVGGVHPIRYAREALNFVHLLNRALA